MRPSPCVTSCGRAGLKCIDNKGISMNICKQCKTEYQAKRSTSEYCSTACRIKAHRATDPAAVTLSDVSVASVTLRPGVVTLSRPPIPCDAHYAGVCHQVDGQWQVRPDYRAQLTPAMATDIKAMVDTCRHSQLTAQGTV